MVERGSLGLGGMVRALERVQSWDWENGPSARTSADMESEAPAECSNECSHSQIRKHGTALHWSGASWPGSGYVWSLWVPPQSRPMFVIIDRLTPLTAD